MSPYGLTKLFGEKFLDYISLTNKNWKIISLRYFNPVGSHISGEIGDNPNKPNNIMPSFIPYANLLRCYTMMYRYVNFKS